MIDSELDPIIEQIAREARRPVAVDPDAKERLLAAIRAESAPGDAGDEWESGAPQRAGIFLTRGRFAAMAAGLVGVGALLGLGLGFGRGDQTIGLPTDVVATGQSAPPSATSSPDTVVKFVFVAPHATKVSVVGDFNQWDATATPMKRDQDTGVWTVTLQLAAGRHLYSFLSVGADGERWVADPTAPTAPDDGFGRNNSVVLVGKGSL
jgi:hypothetical protein